MLARRSHRPTPDGKVPVRSPAQRHHLAAVGDDGGAGDEAAGVGYEQQKRAVEVARIAEPADRNVALDGGAFFRRVIAVELGLDPARRASCSATCCSQAASPPRRSPPTKRHSSTTRSGCAASTAPALLPRPPAMPTRRAITGAELVSSSLCPAICRQRPCYDAASSPGYACSLSPIDDAKQRRMDMTATSDSAPYSPFVTTGLDPVVHADGPIPQVPSFHPAITHKLSRRMDCRAFVRRRIVAGGCRAVTTARRRVKPGNDDTRVHSRDAHSHPRLAHKAHETFTSRKKEGKRSAERRIQFRWPRLISRRSRGRCRPHAFRRSTAALSARASASWNHRMQTGGPSPAPVQRAPRGPVTRRTG